MKKDEIIVLLKEQLQLANEQLQQANATVSSLTTQVNELIERIKSLEEGTRQARFRQEVRTSGKESTSLDDPGGI